MSEITNFKGDSQPAQQSTSIDRAAQQLILRVGERVRKARERKGIPRRVLSELSGVSPRYLAQLEAGAGNISIGLLERVAIALDHRIEWFLSEDDPWTSDALRMMNLFQTADKATQGAVLDLLTPDTPSARKAQRICLLGLRGAGKSTLGAAASAKLGVPFLELNREIETHGGMPVSEVMALYGQDGYRKLESEALQRVIATHESVILAVAGGIVAEPMTYNELLGHFHTVWVKADPEEHMSRVQAQGDDRPMAGNPEAMEQLRALLASREPVYDRAEAKLDTSGCSLETSLVDLLALIEDEGYLR
ncbi:helix-turn-helix transcriptional regulator [Shimia abyssi]|nr:helix-turn-helix transcriptional regulator [Shimia abyssi]